MLVDEPTGQIVGDLSADLDVKEHGGVSRPPRTDGGADSVADLTHDQAAGKEPVVVEIDATGQVHVSPLSKIAANYGQSGSSIIGGAEYLSRGILGGAEKLSNAMSRSASGYVAKRPPTDSPLVFHPVAKTGVKGVYGFTNQAVVVSGKTVEVVGRFAGRIGCARRCLLY